MRKSCNNITSTLFVMCAAVLLTHMLLLPFPAVHSSPAGPHHHNLLTWLPSPCRGSMAECVATGEADADELGLGLELDMDSEINRRILATRRNYISYGALCRNSVPCSRRGASYYNCRRGAQANPYSRGCSAITRCRR